MEEDSFRGPLFAPHTPSISETICSQMCLHVERDEALHGAMGCRTSSRLDSNRLREIEPPTVPGHQDAYQPGLFEALFASPAHIGSDYAITLTEFPSSWVAASNIAPASVR